MRHIVHIFILVLLLSVSAFAKDSDYPTLKITTCNWQPYAGVNLTNYGFASDLMTIILNRMGYKTQIDILPWKRAMVMTKSGKYALAYNAYYSKDRAREYAFTDPYIHSEIYLCSKKDAKISFTTLKELKPYRIGLVMGYVNPTAIENADYLTKDYVVTDFQNLKKLIGRRVDLIVIDKYVATHSVKTSPFLIANITDLVFHSPALAKLPVHAMFSRAVPGYMKKVDAFNRELAKVIKDGTFDTLMEVHNFK
ncbi:MAG: transporter substrate-binding domain-containing protein [Desulfobacter sp.]|nr:MAG: transporter substrate-binding domain-containing protein [Desulfobacter sp.]